jgi:hypothetical protein
VKKVSSQGIIFGNEERTIVLIFYSYRMRWIPWRVIRNTVVTVSKDIEFMEGVKFGNWLLETTPQVQAVVVIDRDDAERHQKIARDGNKLDFRLLPPKG